MCKDHLVHLLKEPTDGPQVLQKLAALKRRVAAILSVQQI